MTRIGSQRRRKKNYITQKIEIILLFIPISHNSVKYTDTNVIQTQ